MQTRPRSKQKRLKRRPVVEGKPGVTLRPYQVLLRPLVTEKGTHQSTKNNAYSFMVNPLSTKEEIKKSVEELFGVRVEKVRTQNREGKKRRFRYRVGKLSNWKKAIVTLHPEDMIEFF